LSRDLYGYSGLMSKSLGAPESGVGSPDGTRRRNHRTVSVKHHEGCILVGQPAEGRQRDEAISSDHDQSPKPVTNARKTGCAAVVADAVLKD
jgi:hypothetical protein